MDPARRPLRSRQTRWATACAAWLARRGATPNAISAFSVLCALATALLLFATIRATRPAADALLFVLAAFAIQARLLCNLFDGMVAVEGGRKTALGPLYNEFPDRLADSLALVAAGYAAGRATIGWAAALLAMLTAYTRVLGASVGAGTYFVGPMAKQQRMAVLTAACAAAAVVGFWRDARVVLALALWVIVAGSALTTINRLTRVARDLRRAAP